MIDQLPQALGAYTLTNVLREDDDAVIFAAVQTVVNRPVEVVVLKAAAVERGMTAEFVSNARAKAALHCECINEVIEAGEIHGVWYAAQERLTGTPFAELLEKGTRLTMRQALAFLRALANAVSCFREKNLASKPLTPDMIFLSGKDRVSFANPVKSGSYEESESSVFMRAMGDLLKSLLPVNQPGQTRMATLCTWMRDGVDGSELSWNDLGNLVQQLEDQLGLDKRTAAASNGMPSIALLLEKMELPKPVRRMGRTAAVIAGLLLTASGLAWYLTPGRTAKPARAAEAGKSSPVALVMDSSEVHWLEPHPVTIREYARFLEELPTLSPSQKERIMAGIPAEADMKPEDWDFMFEMAMKHRTWNGREISLSSPVVNVNYWMALACSRHLGGRLPNKEELALAASPRFSEKVRFPHGLSEWTSTYERRGAMFDPAYVQRSTSGQWNYEADPARGDSHLGFRTAYDTLPSS